MALTKIDEKSSKNKLYFEIDAIGAYSFKDYINVYEFGHVITPFGATYSIKYKITDSGEECLEPDYQDLTEQTQCYTKADFSDFVIDVTSYGTSPVVVEFSFGR